jgi:tetratricopeptide (TPR) repeat protein
MSANNDVRLVLLGEAPEPPGLDVEALLGHRAASQEARDIFVACAAVGLLRKGKQNDLLTLLRRHPIHAGLPSIPPPTAEPRRLVESLVAVADLASANGLKAAAVFLMSLALRTDPRQGWVACSLGWLYMSLGNFDDAILAARHAISVAPDEAGGWMLQADIERERGDSNASLGYLYRALSLAPEDPAVRAALGAAHGALRQLELARYHYASALDFRPDDIASLRSLAWTVLSLTQIDDALALAHRAVEQAPDDAAALHLLGWAMFSASQFAAAADLLENALDRHPADLALLGVYREAAKRVARQEELLNRWKRALAVAPDDPKVFLGYAAALAIAGRSSDAEEVLRAAGPLLSDADRMDLWLQHGDANAAGLILPRLPPSLERDKLEARLHLLSGDATRGWAALDRLVAAHPEDLELHRLRVLHAAKGPAEHGLESARILARRLPFDQEAQRLLVLQALNEGDRATAANVMKRGRALWPADPAWVDFAMRIGDEVAPQTQPRVDIQRPSHVTDATMPGVSSMSPGRLLMAFESLGDNCEFGLVQRRYGIEPLGLFRFVWATIDRIANVVGNSLAGIGEAAELQLRLSHDDPTLRPEFITMLPRYDISWHTQIFVGDKTADRVKRDEADKMRFLKRSMLLDLAEGRKIYVARRKEPLRLGDVRALWTALRHHGPNNLLYVVPADDEHPPGTVDWLDDGLMRGHLELLPPSYDAITYAPESWLTVCRRAFAMARLTGRCGEPYDE